MATWQTDARNAARRYGLGDWFVRQMGQEAHGADLTSPAGAQGPAQIMPATARAWGLSPSAVHDRRTAYDAAAQHMAGYVHQFGSVKNALVAYNAGPGRVGHALPAETQGYISTILGGSNPSPTSRPVTPAASGGTAPGSSSQPGATSPDLGGQGSDFAGLLSSLLAKPQTQAQAPMALQAPAFAAAPPLPQGFRGLLATQAPAPSAQTGVSDALGLISALGGSSPANGIPGASQTADGPQMAPAPTGGTAAPVKGSGKLATFDGKQVAGWIAPALEYARQHGWKGTVSSGYRTDAEQTRIYDSGVRPAAVPKSEGGSGSNHEGAVFPLGAIDVTNAGQLSQILRNSPYRMKLQWAGSKDPVHFSHPHGGGY